MERKVYCRHKVYDNVEDLRKAIVDVFEDSESNYSKTLR